METVQVRERLGVGVGEAALDAIQGKGGSTTAMRVHDHPVMQFDNPNSRGEWGDKMEPEPHTYLTGSCVEVAWMYNVVRTGFYQSTHCTTCVQFCPLTLQRNHNTHSTQCVTSKNRVSAGNRFERMKLRQSFAFDTCKGSVHSSVYTRIPTKHCRDTDLPRYKHHREITPSASC